ncbi:hypothetical protein NDN08_002138 [Rhodosorus marinus]|uniref:Glycosyl hydrolase family 98 putative carbohydrate-binding module domain-containing protein n=1 Tax=Rhodosorus marinus TaxID=101924 RepID=A0AAV8UX67_9RHOD|nr:hypothetical protein NDN08_002138 [Rhodosorus marinus]
MEDIVHETVLEGEFEVPIDIDWIPGDPPRMILCDKSGVIYLQIDGVLQSKPFLDISDKVVSFGDRGLVSCLIDKEFEKRPFLYVSYVDNRVNNPADGPLSGKVARYAVESDLSSASEEEVVLLGTETPPPEGCGTTPSIGKKDILCLDTRHHNLGGLTMSPGGNLYVGIGDAAMPVVFDGLPLRAQDPDFAVGKIYCIMPNGLACADNPFVDDEGNRTSNRAKLHNYGTRNPFRLNWDPVLGVPLVGQVGHSTIESLFPGYPLSNFGWPCIEGNEVNVKTTEQPVCVDMADGAIKVESPLWAYSHDLGTSITGAARLTSSIWPSNLRGLIAVCDYTKQWIKLIEVDEGGIVGRPKDLLSDLKGPVQLKQGPDGWLYYLSLVGRKVVRIRYEEDESVPEVVRVHPPAMAENVEVTEVLRVKFSKQIDERTISGQNIWAAKRATEERVEATLEWDPATKEVVIRPVSRLYKMTYYVVTVLADIEDGRGQKLKSKFMSSFMTGTGLSVYLSDLPFLTEQNGIKSVPVLRDLQQFLDLEQVQPPISLRGVSYEKGIGVVCRSTVKVALPEECKRFQSYVGVDDLRKALETVELFFKVRKFSPGAGAETLYEDISALTRSKRAKLIDVNVRGAETVTISCRKSDVTRFGLAIGSWADAKFRCGDYDRNRPEVVRMEPVGRLRIWEAITVVFSEPMDIISSLEATEMLLPIALGGYEIGFTAKFSADQTQMIIQPNQQLLYDTTYLVTIKSSARDLAGNELRGDVKHEFMTTTIYPRGLKVRLAELTVQVVDPPEAFTTSSEGRNAVLRLRSDVSVEYMAPGVCRTLKMNVAANPSGSDLDFKVTGDRGQSLCRSRGIRGSDEPIHLECSLKDQNTFKLVATGGTGVVRVLDAVLECSSEAKQSRCLFDSDMPESFRVHDNISFGAKCYNYKGDLIPASIDNRNVIVASTQIRPQTVTVGVTTMPSGLKVAVDSLSGPSPLKSIVVVGANFTVNVPTKSYGGDFQGWDDNPSVGPTRSFLFNTPGTRDYNAFYS